jgi:hypothetical protein
MSNSTGVPTIAEDIHAVEAAVVFAAVPLFVIPLSIILYRLLRRLCINSRELSGSRVEIAEQEQNTSIFELLWRAEREIPNENLKEKKLNLVPSSAWVANFMATTKTGKIWVYSKKIHNFRCRK